LPHIYFFVLVVQPNTPYIQTYIKILILLVAIATEHYILLAIHEGVKIVTRYMDFTVLFYLYSILGDYLNKTGSHHHQRALRPVITTLDDMVRTIGLDYGS
jgi:hypothetical protein